MPLGAFCMRRVLPHGNPLRGRSRSNRRRFPMLRVTLSTIAASLLALTINVSLAQAQPARVFVAAQGNDANPCTFALPCRTFQRAHNAVAAGGEIDVLDPAGYGAVTITKSISIQGHAYYGGSALRIENCMISNLNTGIVSTATGSLSVSNSFIGHNINDSVLISAN